MGANAPGQGHNSMGAEGASLFRSNQSSIHNASGIFETQSFNSDPISLNGSVGSGSGYNSSKFGNQLIHKKRTRWSHEEVALVRNLIQQYHPRQIPGDSVFQISRQLGRTQKAVSNKIHKVKNEMKGELGV